MGDKCQNSSKNKFLLSSGTNFLCFTATPVLISLQLGEEGNYAVHSLRPKRIL